jgi:DNA-binding MarR family transcriptional regulator
MRCRFAFCGISVSARKSWFRKSCKPAGGRRVWWPFSPPWKDAKPTGTRYHKRKHRWILIPDRGLCLHYYFYFIDPWLGLCFARVPTWAPFRFQVYANGHQWLARRLEGEGIGYRMADNAFLSVDDFERAQELANSAWRVEELHRQFDGFAQRFCPILKELETNFQWTVNQCEYATDVIFKKPELLQPLYERLIRTAVQTVQAGMLATFLGKRAQGNYPHEVGNHLQKRTQDTRLKHVLGKLSIKVYDKMGSIVRVETTANDVGCFGHYRLVEQRNGGGLVRKRAKMKKSIYSLPILRERMHGSNHRYLDFLSAIDDPRAGLRKLHKLCEPVECNERSYAGFNFFSPQNLALMTVLMRGEYNTNGLRNKDLREHLEDRSPGQVSRLLKRLRLHGLVKKSGGGYRYFVTSLGKQALALGLMLRDLKIIPALAN